MTDKSGSLSAFFVQTIWFMVNTCFSSGSLEFWYMLGEGVHTSALNKTVSAESLTDSLDRNMVHKLHFPCWGESVLSATPQ